MNKMTDNEAFMCKVIFGLSMLFGGTLAWGLKEHNEKKRQAKLATQLYDLCKFNDGLTSMAVHTLGDIANKLVDEKKAAESESEDVDDADKSK